MNQVHFIGIGAMKAGTTWLHDYLKNHDEVLASPIKEMNFFTSHLRRKEYPHILNGFVSRYCEFSSSCDFKQPNQVEKLRNLSDRLAMEFNPYHYLNFFESRLSGQSAYGEISPSYADLGSEDFAYITRLCPNAKFIFIMRDPVSRLLSHIRFDKKLNQKLSISQLLEKAVNPSSVFQIRSRYDVTIKNLEKSVPKENIIYLFYESMFCNEEVARLCGFLGISNKNADFGKKKNKNDAMPYFDWDEGFVREIRESLSSTYDFCNYRFGRLIPDDWL
ncbi:sulfotransferase [Halomonas halmophila]|uniref:Sulfotransferase n=1 Tax=Halomonas halmophila TaxID=252 RepID=A0A4Y4F3Y6_9GAMM|nr:sulfotransferase [Halomonas halmophila]GED23435.1 hypothetical protein HHA01_24120 [Halomonas halmophila]